MSRETLPEASVSRILRKSKEKRTAALVGESAAECWMDLRAAVVNQGILPPCRLLRQCVALKIIFSRRRRAQRANSVMMASVRLLLPRGPGKLGSIKFIARNCSFSFPLCSARGSAGDGSVRCPGEFKGVIWFYRLVPPSFSFYGASSFG